MTLNPEHRGRVPSASDKNGVNLLLARGQSPETTGCSRPSRKGAGPLWSRAAPQSISGGRAEANGHWAPALHRVQAPSSMGRGAVPWGCSPLSPLALCMWASSQLPCFFLLSVLIIVTTCPQGRGGPSLPTKPAVYTARGRLCADKGDLLVRESACSPALLFWGSHLGAPFLLLALLLWHTLSPVSLLP